VEAYYVPINKFYPANATEICYSIALGATLAGLAIVYSGLLDQPETPDGAAWQELCHSVLSWFTILAWWYPLDSSFFLFYYENGFFHGSSSAHPAAEFVFSISLALILTTIFAVLAAGISSTVTDLDVGLDPDKKEGEGETTALLQPPPPQHADVP
jgi:hypothetical protein